MLINNKIPFWFRFGVCAPKIKKKIKNHTKGAPNNLRTERRLWRAEASGAMGSLEHGLEQTHVLGLGLGLRFSPSEFRFGMS